MKPVVAIIGRTNTGKSTLFNRLIGKRVSIVSDVSGTTRDRVFADVTWDDRTLTLVDTGGLEPEPGTAISRKVRTQVETAITEADIIVFLLDVNDGLVPADLDIADRLRLAEKPVLYAVNKVDNEKLAAQLADFYRLADPDSLSPVSAFHNRGIGGLKERILASVPLPGGIEEPATREILKLTIVGRPGVGKSTLLNAIVGEERAIVGDQPGTTRDALDTPFQYKGTEILLIDTAGLKQRGRIGTGIGYYSLIRTLRSIERCDIALLVVDAAELITAQDTHVARYILEASRGIVVAVNKWDLIPADRREEWRAAIEQRLKFVRYAPVLYGSAKMRVGISRILEQAATVWRERTRQLPPDSVRDIILSAVAAHPPPPKGIKRIRITGAYQDAVNPPAFVIEANEPDMVHFSYQRYLENRLREAAGFSGTPIKLHFKRKNKKGTTGAS